MPNTPPIPLLPFEESDTGRIRTILRLEADDYGWGALRDVAAIAALAQPPDSSIARKKVVRIRSLAGSLEQALAQEEASPTQRSERMILAALYGRGDGGALVSVDPDEELDMLRLMLRRLATMPDARAARGRKPVDFQRRQIRLLARIFRRCRNESPRQHFTVNHDTQNCSAPASGDFWELVKIVAAAPWQTDRTLADLIGKTLRAAYAK